MRLRLVPELVPSPLWNRSAARLLKQSDWRRVRARHLDAVGPACEVCGREQQKGLICHERWLYEAPTATLAALRMQCRMCDLAVHVGLADNRGRGHVARIQLARVNKVSSEDAEALVEVAYERHASLSAVPEWQVAVHSSLVQAHPELAVLPDLDLAR